MRRPLMRAIDQGQRQLGVAGGKISQNRQSFIARAVVADNQPGGGLGLGRVAVKLFAQVGRTVEGGQQDRN